MKRGVPREYSNKVPHMGGMEQKLLVAHGTSEVGLFHCSVCTIYGSDGQGTSKRPGREEGNMKIT